MSTCRIARPAPQGAPGVGRSPFDRSCGWGEPVGMQVNRFSVLLLALALALPAGAQDTAPAAGSAPAPASATSAAPFKVPPGWRVKTLSGGEVRYCRKDVRLGSRFAKEECLSRDQLELQVNVDAENAARVSQGARVCASAPGCGGN